MICGSKFNCQDWKDKFVGNDDYIAAKCIKNDNNQICLAATNTPEVLNKDAKKKGVSSGIIIAIVSAVVIVVIAIIIGVLIYVKKRTNPNRYFDAPSQEVMTLNPGESIEMNESQSESFENVLHNSNDELDPFIKDFDDDNNNI